ncbi:MAGUK p55 subfamily member 7-like isoform X5 [Portunus trituberculatus]|uniref:MAGUK p55 subfamily member 7-like isoform X5 n=1 Tax=Portunus trituberculatus TaxID=210409 RepID=UPI001E1CF7C6|nr:MAGUK p55 subfamily member 7-like isoform X5 [Portunus trituberculatus]
MTAVMAAGDSGSLSLGGLLSSLEKARVQLDSDEEDFGFLADLLKSRELQALVNVHNKINRTRKTCQALMSNAEEIGISIMKEIHGCTIPTGDAIELFAILQSPHLQGVLQAHDSIAAKDFAPHLPEIPVEVDEDEETVKIVQLVKSNEPMGATIKQDDRTGAIIIARIMHGGAADRSGLIHVGDEVLEVNNFNVVGKTPADVHKILMQAEGTITFKLLPAGSSAHLRESKVRVRAYFDYDPKEDKHIPCKEAGLPFKKMDILHIVTQDDPYWWQARKEGDRNMRAGLIPSRQLQERRILAHRQDQTANGQIAGCILPKSPSCRPSPKVKKIIYDASESEDFDREEVPTYEEVARLYPRPGLPRPVVLIGPPGVGRNELKRRLVALDVDKYRTPVPMTSRPPRPGEVNNRDYQFVTRDELEEEAAAGTLVEHGEFKGHLYGTSAITLKSMINAGYVVILTPHYQALKYLRTAEFKPYVIYIKPPTLAVLKETRLAAHARSTFDENNSRGFTEDEFKDMLKAAARIEFHYSHWFDEVVVNDELSSAFELLVTAVNRVETEPLWVPASWVQ